MNKQQIDDLIRRLNQDSAVRTNETLLFKAAMSSAEGQPVKQGDIRPYDDVQQFLRNGTVPDYVQRFCRSRGLTAQDVNALALRSA